MLFVKPLADRAATNMTVITNEHTYLFDLVASPNVESRSTSLRFHLSGRRLRSPARKRLARGAQSESDVELAAATDP